jgi:Transcriptional regulator, contains sigma factor-related N-terminal domain
MAERDKLREESHFRVLRALEENPHMSQRELAQTLGVSVAKVNYLINALVAKGHVKIEAFRRSGDKLNKIAYLLTPQGLSNRMALTRHYLERKTREYEALKAEIEALQQAVDLETDAVVIKGGKS